MLDGLFSTLLKCFAHLFKIASLPVRRVLLSASSNVVAPEPFGSLNGFQCILKVLHDLSVRKRLNFFCFLPQPGNLHVPKPGLDCLTNIAAGYFLGLDTELVSS